MSDLLVSECCGARTYVTGSRDGTRYYVCKLCDNPCDRITLKEYDQRFMRENERLRKAADDEYTIRVEVDRRLDQAYAENERLRSALRHLHEFGVRLMGSDDMEERSIGCCIAEGSRIVASTTTEGTPDGA